TWGTRAAAVSAVLAGKAAGVGFVLTETVYAAVDLDECYDPATKEIAPWAHTIIDSAPNVYIEVTPSGRGLRLIGTASGPATHRRFNISAANGAGVECYRKATRYICVTGLELGHCVELRNIDDVIDAVVARFDGAGHTEKEGHQADAGNGDDDIDNIIRFGVPEGQRSEAFARCVWS